MNYDVILADPPWEFLYWVPGQGKKKASRAAEAHYPVMPTKKICEMDIPANDNAILFLWSVWPKLPDAIQVIEAWGFDYKTIGWVWIKAKRSGLGFFMGMGYYTRSNSEPCLLATRGSMPVARHDIQALIYHPVMEHSRKPDDQYRKIEALYPDMKYLELFARRKREGWDAWGNEIANDVELVPTVSSE